MRKKKSMLSSEDEAHWLQAVHGVKRLQTDKILINKCENEVYPTYNHKDEHQFEELLSFHEFDPQPILTPECGLSYHQSGIGHKILRNLRKGQYNVDAVLDLHGMTVELARHNLKEFLQQCLLTQSRVALIIHGKGKHNQVPILKNKLNQWLRTLDIVLAFCSATNQHGQRGAVYVYLKRINEENLLG